MAVQRRKRRRSGILEVSEGFEQSVRQLPGREVCEACPSTHLRAVSSQSDSCQGERCARHVLALTSGL